MPLSTRSESSQYNSAEPWERWSFFDLDDDQNLSGVICQCFLQAIILLLTQRVLCGDLNEARGLKAYIICVNVLCLMHTILRLVYAFDFIHHRLDAHMIPLLILPIMVTVETTAVQAYFLLRCWHMIGKKVWAIVPFVSLWVASFGAGICFSFTARDNLSQMMTLASWVGFSFTLDVCMTIISMVFLIKSWRKSKNMSSILLTLWNMLWLAAIPPMCAMIVVIVTAYLVDGYDAWASFFYDITSKLFVLSLMISLTAREFAAQKLKTAVQVELNAAARTSAAAALGRLSDSQLKVSTDLDPA